LKGIFSNLGPGFIIADTGVGAGDMIAATVAGSTVVYLLEMKLL